MVAPEDDSNGDYWNLVTGVDVHAAYWDLNWVEEMACLDFQKLVDGEYQIGLDWLYMYISDLPICHGGMVWECMNNEWDLGSDVMACFHEIPGQATADNYSENWMLWPSKHQLVPMEVTDNFDQYWIDTYETVQWETLDDFDNHFNAHYNDYLVGKDLEDVRYCLPAVMDFPYRLPRHEPMSRRQGDGWHSTNKYQGHYVNDGRKSMNAEVDSLGRLCFNRDMNGKLSQMQVNTIDMIEGMKIDYSFTVDGDGNREIPENQARAAQVLN